VVRDRVGAVQDGVVNGGGDAEAVVAGVRGGQLGERGGGVAGELSQPVEERQPLVVDDLIGSGHGAPDIPGQHLHIAERGHVPDQVARDPPVAGFLHEAEAERGRVRRPAAAKPPRVACDEEPVSRHVHQIEVDVEQPQLHVIDLRVGQRPALRRLVPVLADPVILERAWAEVAAETAPRPRGRALRTQHGHGQHGEMPAVARQPAGRLPGYGERPAVLRHHAFQQPADRSNVHAGPALLGERHPVRPGDELVDQQAMSHLGQSGDSVR
jgi:hypothetical protein